jgi:hypothetical protein
MRGLCASGQVIFSLCFLLLVSGFLHLSALRVVTAADAESKLPPLDEVHAMPKPGKNEAVSNSPSVHQYPRPMAMLLLEQPISSGAFTVEGINAELRKIVPDYQGEVTPLGTAAAKPLAAPGAQEPLLLNMAGEALATVMFVNAPMPAQALGLAISTAANYWPQGSDPAGIVSRHRAHIIISTLNEPGNEPIERPEGLDPRVDPRHINYLAAARQITMLAAALANLSSATAIHWASGATLRPVATLISGAQGVKQGKWPTNLWTQFDLRRGPPTAKGEQTVGVFSFGMSAFLGREIEFKPSTLPVPYMADRLQGLVTYLLNFGLVVRDGETVGTTEEEKIRLRYVRAGANHPLGQGRPLLVLSIDGGAGVGD